MHGSIRLRFVSLVAGLCLLSATPWSSVSAEDPPPPAGPLAQVTDSDPLEPINRITSEVNNGLRTLFINPMSEFYEKIIPPGGQSTFENVISNLTEPLTALSSLLQGDMENAGKATQRFFINTTVGLAGTMDRASEMGIEHRKEDLGQAAGANGVPPGPHLVLPLIGPSNLRDASGDIVNFFINPLSIANTADSAVGYSQNREPLNAAREGALDPYVVERDAYEQYRVYQVQNASTEDEADDFPEIELE